MASTSSTLLIMAVFCTLVIAQHRITETPIDSRHWLIHALETTTENQARRPQEVPSFYDNNSATPRSVSESLSLTAASLFSVQDLHFIEGISDWFFSSETMDETWKPVKKVSVTHPFIFFHQRKAGGTSVRESLVHASYAQNVPSFVTCFNKVPCDTYQLGRDQAYAVYAGHFKWGAQSDLARFHLSARDSFSCATNFREPLRRIESCLYYRFSIKLSNRCLNDLSLEELEQALLWVDEYGQSCLNEPFRMMSGESDESSIDNLLPNRKRNSTSLPTSTINIFNNTLIHLVRCTPVVLEIPESYIALSQRIPALGQHGAFSPFSHVNQGKQHCSQVDELHRGVIESKAALEMVLYDLVYRKVKSKVHQSPGYKFHHHCLLNASNNRIYRLNSEVEYSTALRNSKDTTKEVQNWPVAVVTSGVEGSSLVAKLIETAAGFEMVKEFLVAKSDPRLMMNASMIHLQAGTFQITNAMNLNLSIYNCQSLKGHCRSKKEILASVHRFAIIVQDPFYGLYNRLFSNISTDAKLKEADYLKIFQNWKRGKQKDTSDNLLAFHLATLRGRRNLQAYKITKLNEGEMLVRYPGGKTQVIKLNPSQVIVPGNGSLRLADGQTAFKTIIRKSTLQTVKSNSGKQHNMYNSAIFNANPNVEVLTVDFEAAKELHSFESKDAAASFHDHYSLLMHDLTFHSVKRIIRELEENKGTLLQATRKSIRQHHNSILFISYESLMYQAYVMLQNYLSSENQPTPSLTQKLEKQYARRDNILKLLTFLGLEKEGQSGQLGCIFSFLRDTESTFYQGMHAMETFFGKNPKLLRSISNWLKVEVEREMKLNANSQIYLHYTV